MLKLWVLDTDELFARCVQKSLTGELKSSVVYMGRLGSLRELRALPESDMPDVLVAADTFYVRLSQNERALSGGTSVIVTSLKLDFAAGFSGRGPRCTAMQKPFSAANFRSLLASIIDEREQEYAGEITREKLEQLTRYIDSHLESDLCLDALAREVHYSPSYLSRAFKQQTGEALSAYVKSARIDRAKTLLANTDYQVQEIAELVGMPKINTFGTVFKSVTGLSPTQYRARMLRETR